MDMSKFKVGDRIRCNLWPQFEGVIVTVDGDWYGVKFDTISSVLPYEGHMLGLIPTPLELNKWYEFTSSLDILNLYYPQSLKDVGVNYGYSWDEKGNITHFRLFKREPMVEVKTVYGFGTGGDWTFDYYMSEFSGVDFSHKITFNTVDGEPDVGSVKMEKL